MRRVWLTLTLLAGAVSLTTLYLAGNAWAARWLLFSREGLGRGELWRLVTGPLIHASAGHAVRDLATLTVVGLLWEGRAARYRAALLLAVVLAPLAAAVATPSLRLYFGLSGAAYAGLAAGLLGQWRRGPRPLVALVLATVVAKVVAEQVTGQLLLSVGHPSSVAPIPVAHLAGLICGALALGGWPLGSRHPARAGSRM